MVSFTPFPILSTERLSLRQLKMEDDKEIFFFRSDERINKYLVSPIAKSIEDARQFIHKINMLVSNNESIYWGIAPKNEGRLIGTICLWNLSIDETEAEIGYVLHPDWQSKGLMLEAIREVIKYAFETMKLRTLEAVLDPANEKSISSLKRVGFIYEGESDDAVSYKLLSPADKL